MSIRIHSSLLAIVIGGHCHGTGPLSETPPGHRSADPVGQVDVGLWDEAVKMPPA